MFPAQAINHDDLCQDVSYFFGGGVGGGLGLNCGVGEGVRPAVVGPTPPLGLGGIVGLRVPIRRSFEAISYFFDGGGAGGTGLNAGGGDGVTPFSK